MSDELLNAIWQVESSGKLNPPDGDNGKSIGPLQCGKPAYLDAKEWDKTINFPYEDLRGNLDKSKIVAKAYMRRYGPDHATNEELARIWNGGGGILKKDKSSTAWRNTTKYWEKVKTHI